jgi:hypothetical protein
MIEGKILQSLSRIVDKQQEINPFLKKIHKNHKNICVFEKKAVPLGDF